MAQNQCNERSRRGPTTKIHALVDGLGNPLHVHLTPGNVNDITEAPQLVEVAQARHFIADRACDSRALAAAIEAKGMTVVIPSPLDRTRRKIDASSAASSTSGRAATRFDKTAQNYLGFVLLDALRIWLA